MTGVHLRPLRIVSLSVAVAGSLCNILVIVVFLRRRSLRKPINFFLIALAFTDLTRVASTSPGPFIRERDDGEVVCQIMASIAFIEGVLSLDCFAATAVLRYISILHPVMGKKLTTWRVCAVLAVLMLLEIVMMLWPVWISWVPVIYQESVGICLSIGTEKTYTAFVTLIGVVIPSVVTVFCYVSIIIKRRQSRRRVQSVPSTGQTQPAFKDKDMRMLLQIFVLLVFYTLTWVPRTLTAMIVGMDNPAYRTLFETFRLISILNSSIHIFVYMVFNSTFRKEVLGLFPCRIGSGNGESETSHTISNG